mmetsp:Transcript_11209/g.23631  ORF Transcript_11209/g.23631 Transcript_11209/m.23631 type:complete len:106 (-) Transcript_11209:2129-2446(-)
MATPSNLHGGHNLYNIQRPPPCPDKAVATILTENHPINHENEQGAPAAAATVAAPLMAVTMIPSIADLRNGMAMEAVGRIGPEAVEVLAVVVLALKDTIIPIARK